MLGKALLSFPVIKLEHSGGAGTQSVLKKWISELTAWGGLRQACASTAARQNSSTEVQAQRLLPGRASDAPGGAYRGAGLLLTFVSSLGG